MFENNVEKALEANEGTFDITLLNKVTGTTLKDVPVLKANTMNQILETYAVDIGIDRNGSKIIFENKRTGKSTSDSSETVKALELEKGDILAISDDGGVA